MNLPFHFLNLSRELWFLFDGMNRDCRILNPVQAGAMGLGKFSPLYGEHPYDPFPGVFAHLLEEEPLLRRFPFARSDGRISTLEVQETVYMRLPDGSPWQILGNVRDVTEETRKMEKDVQAGLLLASLQEGLVHHGSTGAIVYANSSAQKILGLTLDQLKGRTSLDPRWQSIKEDGSPYPGSDHPAMVTLRTGVNQENVVMGIRKPDGRLTWISVNSQKLPPDQGVVVSFFDITARKNDRMIKELKLQMGLYARDHNQEQLVRWFVNQAERISGSTMAFFQGTDPSLPPGTSMVWSDNTRDHLCTMDLPGARHTPSPEGLWQEALSLNTPVFHNDFPSLPGVLPPGHPPLFRELLVPVRENGRPVGILGVGNKRTDYIEGEDVLLMDLAEGFWKLMKELQLHDSLLRLQAGLESSLHGYAFSDLEGCITYVNPAFLRLWSYENKEQALGRKASSFWKDKEKAEQVYAAVVKEGYWKGELTAQSRDGGTRILETYSQMIRTPQGVPLGLMATFVDVTENRRLVEAALRAERLEALGTLAGGIAHDFNNLMGGIYGCIDIAAVTTDKDHQLSYLHQALNTMGRAKELTRQLLTFSKGGEPQREKLELFPLVRSVVDFVLTGTGVQAEYIFPPGSSECLADENQLAQALRNMAVNALQAMPEGGLLTVRGRKYPEAETTWLVVELEDRGEGIPQENLEKVFDPFFTTRESGSGLGLSTAFSIIKKHGGTIEVESSLGTGSTFTLKIPAGKPSASAATQAGERPSSEAKGKILIMDDEAMLLTVCGAMVRELGYTPHCVATCREALEAWKAAMASGDPFQGGILDLTIPGEAGGVDTARQILSLSPGAALFVSSGYSGDPVLARPEDYGFTASLHKPFTLAELSAVLKGSELKTGA